MRHVNGIVSSLKQQFGSLIYDVKAHFETATQVVGMSTATQMDTMRTQYENDMQRVDTLRNEIEEFVRDQKSVLENLSGSLESTRETANAAISDLSDSIDRLRQQRAMDQKNLTIETTQLRKLIRELEGLMEDGDYSAAGVGDSGGGTTTGSITYSGGFLSHKADALLTFVESVCMGLACDLQDEKDRKAIGLYGVKSMSQPDKGVGLPDIKLSNDRVLLGMKDTMKKTNSPRRIETEDDLAKTKSPRRSRQRTTVGYSSDIVTGDMGLQQEPVVSIDSRCLSCSGSTTTVLAGFKMACLNYQPGAVEYEGALYSRAELVRKRMELLQQARSALKGGGPRSVGVVE